MRALTLSSEGDSRRTLLAIGAVWSLVALVAAMQTLVLVRLDSGAELWRAMGSRLAIIPLWAAATPWILRSARRWPVVGAEGRPSWRHALLHAMLGSAFIVAANVAIRLPLLVGPQGRVEVLAESTVHGLAVYFPVALVVYGVIVGVAHLGRSSGFSAAADGEMEAAARASEHPHAAAPIDRGAPPESQDRVLAPPSHNQIPARAIERTPFADRPAAAPDPCLPVRQWNRTHLVRVAEIDWIEAEDNYVVVHAAGRRYKGRERLSDVESRLDAHRFVRIHRSSIVHVTRIRELQPLTHGDQAVVLRDGTVLRVARSRRRALEERLSLSTESREARRES